MLDISKVIPKVNHHLNKDPKTGRWKKGMSGNPGGFSKDKIELIEKCQALSGEIIDIFMQLVRDPRESGKIRIAAGTQILDRGYGKPQAQKTDESKDETYIPPQMIIQMSKEDFDEYQMEQQDVIQ